MTTTFETERGYGLRRVLGQTLPYLFLFISILPIVIGYIWVIIATFSERTEGLKPVDTQGNFGGFTLENWSFLRETEIWNATLNSFLIAVSMVIIVGFVSTLTGYALARMNFAGRKIFLGLTLVLHAFKAELLLIVQPCSTRVPFCPQTPPPESSAVFPVITQLLTRLGPFWYTPPSRTTMRWRADLSKKPNT